jgi:hypothetical protein
MTWSQSPPEGQKEHLCGEACLLCTLLSLSLYGARVFQGGCCSGPRPLSAGRQAGRLAVGKGIALGSCCALLWVPGTFSI